MKVSQKGLYALQALMMLTRRYTQGAIRIRDIAYEENLPEKFLELILLQMRDRGIVASKKGKGGGYLLAKPPEEITLGSIIRIIDGPLAPLPCASETAYRKCDECVDERSCGTKLVMRQVRDAMSAILDHTTIADVNRTVKIAEDGLRQPDEELMYYI